jgi:cytoskeleton protein RodZ
MQSRRERPAGWRPLPDGALFDADESDALDDLDATPEPRLGALLRETRLRKGLTFADIEGVTRINRHYLEALEAEHYDVLPAPVYARGFLRSYARVLGLDPQEAVAMMPADLPRPPGLDPLPALRRSNNDAPALPIPSLPSIPLAPRALAVAAGIVLLLLAMAWLIPNLGGSDTPTSAGTSAGAPAAVASVPPFDAGKAPNFVGVQREVAQRLLQSLGMTSVPVEVPSDAPEGTVVGQTPQPGADLGTGDNVTLVVSKGPLR